MKSDSRLLEEIVDLTIGCNWKKIDTKEYFSRIHKLLMEAEKLQPYYEGKKESLWGLVKD